MEVQLKKVTMPFGKHKGTEVKKLPGPYVFGLLNHMDITSPMLLNALEERLGVWKKYRGDFHCNICSGIVAPENGELSCCGVVEKVDDVVRASQTDARCLRSAITETVNKILDHSPVTLEDYLNGEYHEDTDTWDLPSDEDIPNR